VGQAAGMAAALCVEQGCEPRALSVRSLQDALLDDAIAPAAVIPLFNVPPNHPQWRCWQRYYLDQPENYPAHGNAPLDWPTSGSADHEHMGEPQIGSPALPVFEGWFKRLAEQTYELKIDIPAAFKGAVLSLVTLQPQVNEELSQLSTPQFIRAIGRVNLSGQWLLTESIERLKTDG